MNTRKLTPIEAGNKIAIPVEWLAALHFEELAALERTTEGVLIRPCPPPTLFTWDEIFAEKLPTGTASTAVETTELSGDDFLF